MTVKEWKEELNCYDDNMEVCFKIDDDIECESWTENRYGQKQVHINENLKPTFMVQVCQYVSVEFGVEKR